MTIRPLMRSRTIASAVVVAATTLSWLTPARPADAIAPRSQRVVMVSDSVGLGAKTALPTAFGPGWDVRVIGTPALFVEQLESKHIRPALAGNPSWFGDHVVVAGGYNYPYWDPARFDRSIDSMITTLTGAGVKHVYWVKLREVKPQFVSASAWRQVQPYYWYFPAVNEHLERALNRHPALTLVDWAANADQPGLTYDAIHLNTTGAALYSNLIRAQVLNANTRMPNGGVTRVKVGVPGTTAVAVNLTTTGPRRNGFLAAYPCDGTRPNVSNVNFVRDQTIAGATIVPVGASGDICVYNHQAAQVIVDLFGRFDATAKLLADAPRRALDTRSGPRQTALVTRPVTVTTNPAVAAVAVNVTAVDPVRRGHVSVHPCGTPKPEASNLNFAPGSATPNLVVAQPDLGGRICLTATADTHLLVDVLASFETGGSLTPIAPERVLDTRVEPAPPVGGQVVRFSLDDLAGPSGTYPALGPTGAIVANLTIANAGQRGFATAYPCGATRPATSNVNYVPGRNVANLVVVRPDASGQVCVYTSRAVEVIVDVQGVAGPGFTGIVPQRLVDTRAR